MIDHRDEPIVDHVVLVGVVGASREVTISHGGQGAPEFLDQSPHAIVATDVLGTVVHSLNHSDQFSVLIERFGCEGDLPLFSALCHHLTLVAVELIIVGVPVDIEFEMCVLRSVEDFVRERLTPAAVGIERGTRPCRPDGFLARRAGQFFEGTVPRHDFVVRVEHEHRKTDPVEKRFVVDVEFVLILVFLGREQGLVCLQSGLHAGNACPYRVYEFGLRSCEFVGNRFVSVAESVIEPVEGRFYHRFERGTVRRGERRPRNTRLRVFTSETRRFRNSRLTVRKQSVQMVGLCLLQFVAGTRPTVYVRYRICRNIVIP